jgi:4-aminobutyrate aminotransferase
MGVDSLQTRDRKTIAGLQKLRFFPNSIVAGHGCHVVEEDGRHLLDFSASWGAASLGYAHPAVVDAVSGALKHQAGASILSAVNQPAVELAEQLLEIVPGRQDNRVWLGHSGSDAIEAGLRSIMAASDRSRIISFVGAYHGGTTGSMSISGHSSQAAAPKYSGSLFLPYPDPYRPFMGDETGQKILELLDYHLSTDCPADQIAAVFIEPIMSDGGLIVPPPGFLRGLESRLRPHGVLIVCDEVKVGMGRTGMWHCFEHENIRPDMVVMGKGLGGGLPLSAVVGPEKILNIAQAFAMETTCGNPVCASAGLSVLKTIQQDHLIEHAAETGNYMITELRKWADTCSLVGDVRGRGLAIGIELVKNDKDRTPAVSETAKVVFRAYELGLIIYYVGMNSNVLEMTPPLILSHSEASQGLNILKQAITDVEHGRVADKKIEGYQGW